MNQILNSAHPPVKYHNPDVENIVDGENETKSVQNDASRIDPESGLRLAG